jgi:transcriptional regulator with XRE-family HTH domain
VNVGPEHTPVQAGRWEVARRFGSVLRELRQQRGLTQETLAELADLDRTYPGMLERGLRTPTLAVILRLAKALGTKSDPTDYIKPSVELPKLANCWTPNSELADLLASRPTLLHEWAKEDSLWHDG